jgi:hypothetical protein
MSKNIFIICLHVITISIQKFHINISMYLDIHTYVFIGFIDAGVIWKIIPMLLGFDRTVEVNKHMYTYVFTYIYIYVYIYICICIHI